MLIYVDDILITSSDVAYIQNLITDLNSQFSLKNLGALNFFLGIEVHRNNNGVHLCQPKHTKKQDAKACQSHTTTRVKLFMGDSELYGNPT